MNNSFKRILCLLICLLMGGSCLADGQAQSSKMIQALFHAPSETQDFSWQFPYDDADFSLNPDEYHHKLAQASLGLAMSAFRKVTTDESQHDAYIKSYLTEAGFDHIETRQFDEVPSINSIGTAIGSKQLQDNGEDFTLIALAVSGAGYLDEWESNFCIGDGAVHQGFGHAASVVSERLAEYIGEQNRDGNIRLWITGYSRAAAVSNLAAAMIHEDEALPIQSIYAYTFATPNTTQQPKAYPFIFNIVGQFDPVPAVPFHSWGFQRNGTTLYLPAREVNMDYDTRSEVPRQIYRDLTGGEEFWANPEANWLVHKLCEFFCDFVEGTSDYVAHYQQILIDTYGVRGSILDKLKVCAQEIMASTSIKSELSEEKTAFWSLLSQESYEALMEKIGWRNSSWNHAQNLMANIIHEHFPQTYVAWMMAYPTKEETFSDQTSYKRIAITGPVDVALMLSAGSDPIAEVKDGKITITEGYDLPIMYVGDELLITLPGESDFLLRFTATRDGTLQYMLKEHHSGYIANRTLLFDGIAIKKDESLSAAVQKGEQLDQPDSLLVGQDMHVYCPSTDSKAQSGVTAASDIELQGNPIGEFLTWALIAIAILLLIVFILLYLHHRKKKRKTHNK